MRILALLTVITSRRITPVAHTAAAVAAVLMVAAAGIAQQPAQDADVYAIYSLAMANPPNLHGRDRSRTYAIAEETETIRRDTSETSIETVSGGSVFCVMLPESYTARWKEIQAAVDAATDSPVTLRRELKIKKPYFLLSADEATQLISSIAAQRNPISTDPRLRGALSVYTLGNVYFDRNHTLALTKVSNFCGRLCGYDAVKVYEKTAKGDWQEVRPLRKCDVLA